MMKRIKIKWLEKISITTLDNNNILAQTSVEPGQISEVIIFRVMMDNGKEMIDMDFEECIARSVPRESFRVVLEIDETKNPGE